MYRRSFHQLSPDRPALIGSGVENGGGDFGGFPLRRHTSDSTRR
jgi:hypothetical protein